MSELKNLLQEAKHNLRDLESLLRKARSMDQGQNDQYVLSRDELQKYFEEMFKILESLPDNLKVEGGFEEKGEIKHLHLQMEEVRHKVEECFGRVEAACETNLHELSEFIQNLSSPKLTQTEERKVSTKAPCLSDLLSQGKNHLNDGNFEACLKAVNQALGLDPGNTEAADLLVEAQKKLEDRRLEEELVIHIENLKKEAMEQFDREQYQDCMRTFKFLCELEPKNRTLRDYLELSRQKVQELEDGEFKPVEVSGSAATPETSLKESVLTAKPSIQSSTTPTVETTPAEVPKTPLAVKQRANSVEPSLETLAKTTRPVNQAGRAKEDFSWPRLPDLKEPQAAEQDVKPSGQIRKVIIASIAAAALLFAAILGSRNLVKPPQKPEVLSFDIQSDPNAAQVFIDGELKGQTRLHLQSLTEGNHELRIEMEGYTPLIRTFAMAKGNPTTLSVHLDKVMPLPDNENDLQEAATTLFDQGNYLEASRNCDVLLQKNPQDSFAVGLKNQIRSYYLRQSKNAISKSRWEEAQLALENVLKVSPGSSEASAQLKMVRTKLKRSVVTADTSQAPMTNLTQDLHQQISAAIGAGNYLPPSSGNAVDLLHRLSSVAPSDPFAKEKLDQVYRELVSQVQRKMQAKDFDGAKSLAQQVQTLFPETSELKNLRDTLKAEEAKAMENWSSLVQKAESALTAARYVTPANDNAFAYANRLLTIDSQNQRAVTLRKDSLTKAAAQARDFTQSEKFDEAREVYSALLQPAASDSRSPLTTTELKRELDKLEFASYPVVHDHTLMGSCTGRLRVNAYVISFIPSGNSKDGFSEKLSEIEIESPSDKLKIQVKNKTYRYEANLVRSKEENREKLETIYQRVNELKAKNR